MSSVDYPYFRAFGRCRCASSRPHEKESFNAHHLHLALFIGAASVAAQPANFEIRPGPTGATSTRQASEITYASACGARASAATPRAASSSTKRRAGTSTFWAAGCRADARHDSCACATAGCSRPLHDAGSGRVGRAGVVHAMHRPAGTATMEHGDSRVYQTPRNGGPFEGLQQLTCRNGVLVSGLSMCRRTTECDVSLRWTGSDDGGRTRWQWSGDACRGATAQATAPDGRTRPTCSLASCG